MRVHTGIPGHPGVIAPDVNLNGDKRTVLVERWRAVAEAAALLGAALDQVWPHGRNFTPQGDPANDYAAALVQHRQWAQVVDRLTVEADAVYTQLAEEA